MIEEWRPAAALAEVMPTTQSRQGARRLGAI